MSPNIPPLLATLNKYNIYIYLQLKEDGHNYWPP